MSQLQSSEADRERGACLAELRVAMIIQHRMYRVFTDAQRLICGRIYTCMAAETLQQPWDTVLQLHREILVGNAYWHCWCSL